MTAKTTRKIVLWIVIYAGLRSVLEVGVSPIVWANPAFQFPEIAEVASFPIGLYAVRSIAIGLVTLVALFRRDVASLGAMFLLRLIMDILDLVLVFTGTPPPPFSDLSPILLVVIYTVIFYIPGVFGLRSLWYAQPAGVPQGSG